MRGGANPQVKQVLDWLKSQINSNSGIAEEWHEGANFYVKLKSGLIVQGGKTDKSGLSGIVQTLLIPFSSTNYIVQLTTLMNIITDGGADYVHPNSQTTTQFTCVLAGGYAYWLAIGY